MDVRNFNFGEEDARYLPLKTTGERRAFVRSFVTPKGFRLEDFFDGRKFLVHGLKGSGKTAVLQYIRIHAEDDLNAITGFYYFQTGFKKSELARFRAVLKEQMRVNDELIDDPSFEGEEEIPIFWRMFILSQIAKLLKSASIKSPPGDAFFKAIEALKLISKSKKVGKRYPSLEKFQATISRDPSIMIEGKFEDAGPEDLDSYLELAETYLENIYLGTAPIYLFVDELEIYKSGDDDKDQLNLAAAASLVQAIRDFNERFSEIDIRVIAAVRTEVATEIRGIKEEVYRIVTNRGIPIGWDEPTKIGFHPLEKIVLRQIVAQDFEICEEHLEIETTHLEAAFEKYFSKDYSLSSRP